MYSNCSNLLDLRNFQEQLKKAFCYQKLFWPFTVRTNCSSDLKFFANSRPSASNFKSFSRSLEQFFLTVGQNNFDNKIPFLHCLIATYNILKLQFISDQNNGIFLRKSKVFSLTQGKNQKGFTWMISNNSGGIRI